MSCGACWAASIPSPRHQKVQRIFCSEVYHKNVKDFTPKLSGIYFLKKLSIITFTFQTLVTTWNQSSAVLLLEFSVFSLFSPHPFCQLRLDFLQLFNCLGFLKFCFISGVLIACVSGGQVHPRQNSPWRKGTSCCCICTLRSWNVLAESSKLLFPLWQPTFDLSPVAVFVV